MTGEPCPPAEANTEPSAAQTLPNDDDAEVGPSAAATSTSEESSSAALGEGNNCDSSRESASSSRSTSTRPTTSLLECHQEAPDDIADEAPDETQENIKGAKYSSAVKQSMYEKGLYNRHSLDHPLLQAFAMHLNKEKNIQNYKQEVWTIKYFTLFMKTAICTLTKDEATHS